MRQNPLKPLALEMIKQGLPVEEIAEATGYALATIKHMKVGLDLPSAGRLKERARRKAIADMAATGMTDQEISDKTQYSTFTVQKIRNHAGILQRPPHINQEIILGIVSRLMNTDKNYHEIGEEFGQSQQTVCRLSRKAKAAGIKLRPRKLGRPRNTH